MFPELRQMLHLLESLTPGKTVVVEIVATDILPGEGFGTNSASLGAFNKLAFARTNSSEKK